MGELRARSIALAHDESLCEERCKLWHEHYQPQSLITEHWTTEAARASLLADQVAEFRQAELEEQARHEEHQWRRRQRRRMRYLGIKIKTRPAEAVEHLLGFGAGVEFLVDAFLGLIREVRTVGYLSPQAAMRGLEVCGCTQEPALIGCNPLAYSLLINNLGCAPGVPAADIDPWLEPVRRPAALRDLPRQALIGADPDECRMRLLAALEAERDRLVALADRVHEDVDIPSLCAALNRVCILTEKSALRAARAHTEARVTFRQASKDLVKALDGERKKECGHLSSVNGHLSAGNGAVAEPTAEVGVREETTPVEAGPEGEGAGLADVDQGLPGAPDEGPLPEDRGEDGLFAPKPEELSNPLIQNQYGKDTYVEARVSGSGCAKLRKTGAQTDPPPAQTGAEEGAAAVTDQRPGSDDQAWYKGQRTKDQEAEAGLADVEQGLPSAPDAGPLPTDRREDGFFAPKPENGIDVLIQNPDETTTSGEAPGPGSGCAKMRKTAAQTDPPPAQTGAEAGAAAATYQAAGSEELASDKGPMTNDQGPDQSRRWWTNLAPLSACRREDSLLTDDPETNLPTLHASRSTLHEPTPDPVLALIAKYQKEFDVELRPYDHLE